MSKQATTIILSLFAVNCLFMIIANISLARKEDTRILSTLPTDQPHDPNLITDEFPSVSGHIPSHELLTAKKNAQKTVLRDDERKKLEEPEEKLSPVNENDPTTFRFDDPQMAYKIMQKLDVKEGQPLHFGWTQDQSAKRYQRAFIGVKPDLLYCDKHRARFAENPSYVFNKNNYLTGYWPNDQLRAKGLDVVGDDIQPYIGGHMGYDLSTSKSFDMDPEVSLYVTFDEMFYYRQIGVQFSCLGQESNHIPGHDTLYRKDSAAIALNQYAKNYEGRSHCLNSDKFFPKNYLMADIKQCKEFFEYINSTEYKELKKKQNIVFLRKIGADAHAADGVFPFNDKEETDLRGIYKNGNACGSVSYNNIMQRFVHNALLLNGRKFDFRMFMLIASTDPFIVFYHDGFLRVSLNNYNLTAGDKNSLLTNTAVSKYAFNIAKKQGHYNGMKVSDLYEEHLWHFEKLQDHLLEAGVITDPHWLDNYLRPEFKKAYIHLVRMSQSKFLKRSSVFELYGLDFMLDDELNLWFIEANIKPGVTGFTPRNTQFFTGMLQGQFRIMFQVLKSRMLRVYRFVNTLSKSGEVKMLENGEIEFYNYQKNLKDFQEVIKNKFEPEFEIHASNEWSKIIDENYEGMEKYSGLIDKECF